MANLVGVDISFDEWLKSIGDLTTGSACY
jgi:hypothetical protein